MAWIHRPPTQRRARLRRRRRRRQRRTVRAEETSGIAARVPLESPCWCVTATCIRDVRDVKPPEGEPSGHPEGRGCAPTHRRAAFFHREPIEPSAGSRGIWSHSNGGGLRREAAAERDSCVPDGELSRLQREWLHEGPGAADGSAAADLGTRSGAAPPGWEFDQKAQSQRGEPATGIGTSGKVRRCSTAPCIPEMSHFSPSRGQTARLGYSAPPRRAAYSRHE